MRGLRRTLIVLAVFAAVVPAIAWIIGSLLIKGSNHTVHSPPKELHCTEVTFHSGSGAQIHGWYLAVPHAHKAALLLHPSGGDRTSMLSYARFLAAAGYACLMIDFRCHGESIASGPTFGWNESKDAISGVAWLRQQMPDAKVAVIGTSLGGAAALLAKDGLHADAIVAQSVYGDLRKAIWNRVDMRMGLWAADHFACLLDCQVPLRLGLNLDEVSPVKAAASITCPLFVIHGTEDHHAHLAEGRAIFDASPSPKKQWWAIQGAGHVDLCHYAGAEYQRRVLAFLGESFR